MNNQQNTYDDNAFPKGFTFNGVSSKQLGFVVQTPPKYEMPEKDYTVTHVPGRVGDVITRIDNFKNVERVYNLATVYTPEGNGKLNPQIPVDNFVDKAEQLSAWLMSAQGYCDLTDGYEPQYIRKAMYIGGSEIEDILGQGFTFEVKFNCQPQRYFKGIGLYELESYTPDTGQRYTVKKPTLNTLINKSIFGKPLIYISGEDLVRYDTIKPKIIIYENNSIKNEIYIDIDSMIADYGNRVDIYIDCEKQECYSNSNGSENLNKYITFMNDFIELDFSKNYGITVSFRRDEPTIEHFSFAPRWYRI